MQIVQFINNFLHQVAYISRMAFKEGFSNPFKGIYSEKSKPVYILANGPSLKEFLNDYDENRSKYYGIDFFVVNDFVNDTHFDEIKPKYCALSDPLFFKDTIYSGRGHKTMRSLAEKVKWELLLFIPKLYLSSSYLTVLKENPLIKIIAFHSVHYAGFESLRYWFYKKGLGNGEFGTIALNALYIALMCGYKQIYLYGIDHTFFDNIAVNDNNILCYKESHYYGLDSKLRPMTNHYNGEKDTHTYKMSEFLDEKARIFKGHEIMYSFANLMDASVYNATKNSLVDAYPRLRTLSSYSPTTQK